MSVQGLEQVLTGLKSAAQSQECYDRRLTFIRCFYALQDYFLTLLVLLQLLERRRILCILLERRRLFVKKGQ